MIYRLFSFKRYTVWGLFSTLKISELLWWQLLYENRLEKFHKKNFLYHGKVISVSAFFSKYGSESECWKVEFGSSFKGRIRIFNGVLSYETWMKKFTRKNFFIMGRSDTYLYLHFSSSSAPNQNVERSDSDFQRCPILWKQNILTIIWLIHSLGCFATKLELLENYLNSCQAYSRYLYLYPSLCLHLKKIA